MSEPLIAGEAEDPLQIDIAAADWAAAMPGLEAFAARAVEAATLQVNAIGSVSLSFTDDAAIAKLNAEFRGKTGPTNVLSFPAAPMPGPHGRHLGDIAIAYETVAREAAAAGLSLADHAAHMIVHGVLHLAGYDHQTDNEAEEMEALERAILARLGVADPYAREGAPARGEQ